jgi:hypothetical protein
MKIYIGLKLVAYKFCAAGARPYEYNFFFQLFSLLRLRCVPG